MKHKETRRRNLYLYVPDIIPCGNNFHLVSQSESEILTLNDIYLDYFKQVGQSPMSPLDSYKNQLLNQIVILNLFSSLTNLKNKILGIS